MLGDGELKPFKLKISTSEMHLLCCCRVGHGQEYFEARYGRGVWAREFYTVKKDIVTVR
jgi:hypothetical protein